MHPESPGADRRGVSVPEHRRPGRISNVDGSRANHTASQLIRYLQQHYQEPVSSALLAETFNYHAYHIPLL